jgi:hypothetical protein
VAPALSILNKFPWKFLERVITKHLSTCKCRRAAVYFLSPCSVTGFHLTTLFHYDSRMYPPHSLVVTSTPSTCAIMLQESPPPDWTMAAQAPTDYTLLQQARILRIGGTVVEEEPNTTTSRRRRHCCSRLDIHLPWQPWECHRVCNNDDKLLYW